MFGEPIRFFGGDAIPKKLIGSPNNESPNDTRLNNGTEQWARQDVRTTLNKGSGISAGRGFGPPAGRGLREAGLPAPQPSLRPHHRRKLSGARQLAQHLRHRLRVLDEAERGEAAAGARPEPALHGRAPSSGGHPEAGGASRANVGPAGAGGARAGGGVAKANCARGRISGCPNRLFQGARERTGPVEKGFSFRKLRMLPGHCVWLARPDRSTVGFMDA